MRHWAIRDEHVSGTTLTIKAAGEVGIAKGDPIVALTRHKKGLSFAWHAEIADKQPFQIDDKHRAFRFDLENRKSIESQPTLLDLGFSLVKVYRHRKPHVHFRRPYTYLLPGDFESIVEGRVFWTRTAFGLFVSRLPHSVINTFYQEVAERKPQLLLNASYFELWTAFREIVVDELLVAHSLMDNIRENLNSPGAAASGIEFSDLRLYDDEDDLSNTRHIDSLAVQLRYLDSFKATLGQQEKEPALLDALEEAIQSSDWEDSFEKTFEDRRWQDLLNS